MQFYDTTQITGHAKGGNSWSIGIEIEGRDDEPLTNWQVAACAVIIGAVCGTHRIPRTYYRGENGRRRVNGCLAHLAVPGSDHTDDITYDDWARIAFVWTPTPPPHQIPGALMAYPAVRVIDPTGTQTFCCTHSTKRFMVDQKDVELCQIMGWIPNDPIDLREQPEFTNWFKSLELVGQLP